MSDLSFKHFFNLVKVNIKNTDIVRGWDKSPSLSIVFGLSSKTQWLSGLYSFFTALLNCAEVGRRNRILTNDRFLSYSHNFEMY